MVKIILLLAAPAAFSLLSNAQTLTFTKTSYATGAGPRAVVAADFSANGVLDLAVANSGDDTVSVMEGAAASSAFGAARVSKTAAGPRSLAVGDFNRDGKLDLAVACAGANAVSVLWGDGNGAFSNRADLASGKAPDSVIVADFNRDGYLDIAVANSGSDSVSIFLGSGSGGFRPRTDYATGGSPAALVAGDFNRDTMLDLAVVNAADNSVSILLGRGDGTFAPKMDFRTGSKPSAVVASDFNTDGILDLAVVNAGDNTVSILTGNGDGTFAAKAVAAVGTGPASIAVADFNGDGKADVAVANADGNTVSILIGDGNGSFKPAATLATDAQPLAIAVLDQLPDGKPDLVVANSTAKTAAFYLNATTPWRTGPPLSRLLSASGASWGGLVGFDSDETSYFNYTPDSFQCFGLTIGNYKDSHATVGSNGKIAFESNRDGTGFRIYAVNLDGTSLHQITSAQGLVDPTNHQDRYPVISRDGTQVAFLRNTGTNPYADIYVVGADGTGLRRITTNQADPAGTSYSGIFSVAWNNDGTKIAFRGARIDSGSLKQVLGTINLDGTAEQHLVVWPLISPISHLLDWSADGRRIFFSSDPAYDPNPYWILDYPALTATSIATTALGVPCSNTGCARLSPDGQWLVYQSGSATGSYPAFIRVNGTGRVVFQQFVFGMGEPLFWSAAQDAGDPDHVEVSPNPVFVSTGHDAPVSVQLVDSNGQVLVRAVAGWQFPGLNGAAPRIDPTGVVTAGAGLGDWELDAINAGKTASTTVRTVSSTAVAPRIDSVVNGATWTPGVAAGSWVTIVGSGFSETTRPWQASDFVNGNLPTALEGTAVRINGKSAFVYYVCPTQLNVLAPDDDALGAVPVEVVTGVGRATASAELIAFSPGFFTYQQEGGRYAIAQDSQWNLLAKPGLLGSVPTRGARPGETIVLYGTGFGPANPRLPAATVVAAAQPLANTVDVTIGGSKAQVTWAGQIGSGLCQINVTVPEVDDGDQPLVARVGGASSPAATMITIQH